MGTRYGKRIVTDGLVLCLDAADNISAPHNDLPVKQGCLMWLDGADDSVFTYSSGTSVSEWRDKSGNNNHVSNSNGTYQPSRNVTINSKSAVNFYTSSLQATNVFSSSATSYTKIAVVYQTSSGAGNVISSNTGHAFWFQSSTYVKLHHNGNFVTSSISLPNNTAGIISGTVQYNSSSSASGEVFVNGASGGTGTTSNASINSTTVQIGSFGGANYFIGYIAEVLVYDRVLSSDELTKVHNYLQNKWNIEVSDAKWYDRTANENNASFYNAPVYADTNKGYFELDGVDSYMQGSIDSSTFSGASSVSCWFKRHSVTSWSGLFSNNVSQTSAVLLTFNGTSNQVGINRSGVSAVTIGPTLSNYLNKWIFCTLVLAGSTSGSSILVYVYQDGNLSTTGGTLYWDLNTSSNYYIGRHYTTATQIHDGYISQVLVHNKALSADEVAQNYNATKGRYL
jgi:hypothetical protein